MEKSARYQLTNKDLDRINIKLENYLQAIKNQETLENHFNHKKLQAAMIVGGGVATHVLLQYLFFNLNPLKIPLLALKECLDFLNNKTTPINHQTLLYYSAFMMLCALGLCVLGYQAKKTSNEILELAELLEQYTPIVDTPESISPIAQEETQTPLEHSIEETWHYVSEVTASPN